MEEQEEGTVRGAAVSEEEVKALKEEVMERRKAAVKLQSVRERERERDGLLQ